MKRHRNGRPVRDSSSLTDSQIRNWVRWFQETQFYESAGRVVASAAIHFRVTKARIIAAINAPANIVRGTLSFPKERVNIQHKVPIRIEFGGTIKRKKQNG